MSKENVDELYDGQLCEHTELLEYCPDYKKEKAFIQNVRTIPWDEVKAYIEENYKKSNIYEFEKSLNYQDDEVLYDHIMLQEVSDVAKVRYAVFCEILSALKLQAVDICDLIDYLINYPTRYPVPLEEEKNPYFESLLEEYDMIIRYYLHDDIDGLQLDGDTIKRLVNTLNERGRDIKDIIVYMNELEGYIKFKAKKADMYDNARHVESMIAFPLSYAQKKGGSLVSEGRYYQRLHVETWNEPTKGK